MGKGTEAFPDLGEHCKHEDCKQLDFLPFTCDGCHKVFCLEHRTYKAHGCHESDRKNRVVVVCEICSMSMEKKADEEDKAILERHERSGECDPSKKQKSKCPVARCRQILTFSNRSTCKRCRLEVCLKHRFPSDHACKQLLPPTRTGMDCASRKQNMSVASPTVKAC